MRFSNLAGRAIAAGIALVASALSCGSSQVTADGGACGGPLTWSRVASSPAGFAISGSGPVDIWLLTNGGDIPGGPGNETNNIMEGDGVAWTAVPAAGFENVLGAPTVGAGALWVVTRDDVFAGGIDLASGDSAVGRWDGTRWGTYSLDDDREVTSFWGSGADDVWGMGENYVGHWDGSRWTHVDSVHSGPIAGGAPMDWWSTGMFCSADLGDSGEPCDVNATFCVGFQHHGPSGDYASPVVPPGCAAGPMNAAWASATDDVWFVGQGTFHFDGA